MRFEKATEMDSGRQRKRDLQSETGLHSVLVKWWEY